MYKNLSQNAFKEYRARIKFNANNTIYLNGDWQWNNLDEVALYESTNEIIKNLVQISKSKQLPIINIDTSQVKNLDTAGCYFICEIANKLNQNKIKINEIKFDDSRQTFYDTIRVTKDSLQATKQSLVNKNLIVGLGENLHYIVATIVAILAFFGQFCINLVNWLKSPLDIKWSETIRIIKDAGIKGLLVLSLLCFLIGATLTYEISPQFINYGANLYIVNFLGVSLLKEVAPLLMAIIVTSRTGASITAEIGVMKSEEEIDAMQTMGISPIKRLVLPKVLGLLITMPLITVIADIASLTGGAVVANYSLDIPYNLFVSRLQNYVSVNNYVDGIIKSIFFALAIALISCFCGFRTKGNANSVGEQTTKSVVWSIVAIVIIDAIFTVIFNVLNR